MDDVYSVYAAKARLSEIIRAVKRRRRVTITERGKPVAEVIAYGSAAKPTLAARLADLEARGALSPPPAVGLAEALKPLAARPGGLARFLKERE